VKNASGIGAATPAADLLELAGALPRHLRLGTSSWNFPGWAGIVWDQDYPEAKISRGGLAAYARHPLFRTVSIDRGFYRPLNSAQFQEYAAQTPDDFRFVVKAPAVICDAQIRDEEGRGMKLNPNFLDASQVERLFVEPALSGLGHKLGALVFQFSPLPQLYLTQIPELIDRLHKLLLEIRGLKAAAPDGVVAVEVRDRQWLTPQFVDALRDTKATYCMGLHAKMPRIDEQLPILRKLWPGPLVCRWNLNPLHGAYGYEDARKQYEPFDKLVDPDLDTRAALAKVIAGTAKGGQNVYVTVSNKAEGSAPLSVVELAWAVRNLGA
jgi:uncharacterized protein YecE (DUF72 family)